MSFQSFMIVADTHGKELDPAAWKAAMTFKEHFKPQIRIHNGDLWDFGNIRKGASDTDLAQNVDVDIKAGNQILDDFQPTAFLAGNHDARLWNLIEHPNGVLRDWAIGKVEMIESKLRNLHCLHLPYDSRLGIYRLGNLKVLHGYHAGPNACRMHAQVYGNCVFGHVHAIDSQSIPGLEERDARSIGCLCSLDPDYQSAHTAKLRWRHGFAYGFINTKTGNYDLVQARSINGNWFLPDKFIRI